MVRSFFSAFLSFVIWWLTLLLCLDSFCVCLSQIFSLWLPWGFDTAVCIKTRIFCLTCLFHFKCISNILHYPLLTIASFNIILVCGLFPTFTVCLHLTVKFSICNFLVSVCDLFFSNRSSFSICGKLVRWWWILFDFAWLWSFWFLCWIWMRAFLGRVFLVGGSSLSSL